MLFFVTAFLDDVIFGFFAAALFFAVLPLFAAMAFLDFAVFFGATFLDRALLTTVLFFFVLFFAIPRPPLKSSPWYVGGKAASI